MRLEAVDSFQGGPASPFRHAGQQPRRVQDEGQFRGDVDEGGEQRVQHPDRRQAHAEAVHRQRPGEVEPDDAAAAAGDLRVYLTAPVLGAWAGVLACRCVQEPGCCGRAVAPPKEACP